MLIVSNVSKRFPGAELNILQEISFTVNANECVGLIGPNGSGKSTLLRMIRGEIALDSGSVTLTPGDTRMGYLPQGLATDPETPAEAVVYPQLERIHQLEERLAVLAGALGDAADSPSAQEYDATLTELSLLSQHVDSGAGERALAGLGLGDLDLRTPVGQLSGGQKTRLVLAALLVEAPQLLLLDEPTNHLDVSALVWLEDWLVEFSGGVLIVSHDRRFLDRVVNKVIALDPATATGRTFVGNYSHYLDTLAQERDKQWVQWRDQEVEIARLQHDMERTMARSIRKEQATVNDHQRRLAKKVAAKAKAKETRLERYKSAEERVEKPQQNWTVNMAFDDVHPIRGDAIALNDVSIGYDSAAPLIQQLSLTLQGQERIAVMGPNGHGKTALLRTVVGQIPPLSGQVRIAQSVQVGYLAQEQDVLDPMLTPVETIQHEAEMTHTEARSFLHFFLFAGDDALRLNARLSYGERARLMLARLVARGANLLLLDEPLNHLDLPSREEFEQALMNFPGSVLAVAHDRFFVERFAAKIWHVEDGLLLEELRSIDPSQERA